MAPPGVTVRGWHRAQSGKTTPLCGPMLGGVPWHDPQNACVVLPVQTGLRSWAAVSPASFAPPPWQYELEQVAAFRSQPAWRRRRPRAREGDDAGRR